MSIVRLITALFVLWGLWRVWRRSPLYSGSKVLKILAALVLIVAAGLGIGLTMTSEPVNRNPAAQTIVGIAGFSLLIFGSMVLMIRITDPHLAKLAPGVSLQNHYRRPVQRAMWCFAGLLVIGMVACAVVPRNWLLPTAFPTGLVLLLGSLFIPALYMQARRYDFGLTAITAAPWVHWQYDPARWEVWAEGYHERERSTAGVEKGDWWLSLRITAGFGGILGVGILLMEWIHGNPSLQDSVIGAAALATFLWWARWMQRLVIERHYRRLRVARPETYFGEEGLWSNGQYMPWVTSGFYLVKATAEGDSPQFLTLVFQTSQRYNSGLKEARVLIAEGRASDLAVLQEKLVARCQRATIALAGARVADAMS